MQGEVSPACLHLMRFLYLFSKRCPRTYEGPLECRDTSKNGNYIR